MTERVKILAVLPIILFVLGTAAFDNFATPKSTHWSIFYFSITYISMIMLSVFSIVNFRKGFRVFGYIMGSTFVLYLINELSKWNLPYDQYMESVNKWEVNTMFYMMLSASLISLIIWLKRLGKQY